jgi:hypothetical protein
MKVEEFFKNMQHFSASLLFERKENFRLHRFDKISHFLALSKLFEKAVKYNFVKFLTSKPLAAM